MGFRLYRHDITLYEAASATDDAREPAALKTVDFYRRGAWANETETLLSGSGGTINVIDPGAIVAQQEKSVNIYKALQVVQRVCTTCGYVLQFDASKMDVEQ